MLLAIELDARCDVLQLSHAIHSAVLTSHRSSSLSPGFHVNDLKVLANYLCCFVSMGLNEHSNR